MSTTVCKADVSLFSGLLFLKLHWGSEAMRGGEEAWALRQKWIVFIFLSFPLFD